MKLVLLLSSIALTTSLICCGEPQQKAQEKNVKKELRTNQERKKKIIIFWSKGGGCHYAMVKAMGPMLQDTYDVKEINVLADVLYPIDPIKSMTHNKKDGEDLYNYVLSHDWIRTTNILVEFGRKAMYWRHNSIVKLLEDYLQKEKPDMVISVVPLLNSAYADVCKKLNIPFLLTIMDNVHLYFPVQRPPQNPLEFRCTIPFDDAYWHRHLDKIKINPATIKGVGFPLRKDFFEKKDIAKIKKEYNIPTNKPVVMILMGGAGSAKTVQYVRKICRMKEPLHLIVCIGRAEELKAQLERIKKPDTITMSIIGFTQRVSDLMATADVIITKSGPASLFETFQSQVPLLVDRTCGTVFMEKMLVQTVIDRELGDTIANLRRLPAKLETLLHDKAYRTKIKKNMEKISNKDFEKIFKKIIADFFADREKAANTKSLTAPEKVPATKKLLQKNNIKQSSDLKTK